jgi:uncharacterized protein
MIDYRQKIKKIRIIDAHMHLGVYPSIYYFNYSDRKLINIEKKFNVEKCICSHHINFFSISRALEAIEEASNKFGNYVYWYLVYNPNNYNRSLELIKNNINKTNFAGVKIHPVWHKCAIDDESYFPLWEFCLENDIVILCHTWSPYTENPKQFYADPLLLENILPKFRGLKFIIAHGGGKVHFYNNVIKLLEKYDNLFVDYSGDTLYPKIFRKVIDAVGSKRILFGSDMPWVDIRYHIINIFKADLTKIERKNIFYNNAVNLFNFRD